MATKAEILTQVNELPDGDDQYAVLIFTKHDVLGLAAEIEDVKFSPAQAKELLDQLDRRENNKGKGISMETIACHIVGAAQ